MNARIFAVAAAALASTAALRPAAAAAQTDTTTAGKPAEPPPAANAPAPALPRQRRSLNTITYEEVRVSQAIDAFALVEKLRPSWLRAPRGMIAQSADSDVAVFFDGIRMGSRDALHSIPITSVRSARFYTATEARQKFGGQTFNGAIEVLSN
jgi:hypothetical protein